MSKMRPIPCIKEELIYSDDIFYFELVCPHCNMKITINTSDIGDDEQDEINFWCFFCSEMFHSIGVDEFFERKGGYGRGQRAQSNNT